MGLIQKKDEDAGEFGDVEVIGRGEGPDGTPDPDYDIAEGQTAEDISGTAAARAGELELEADPELMNGIEDDEAAEEEPVGESDGIPADEADAGADEGLSDEPGGEPAEEPSAGSDGVPTDAEPSSADGDGSDGDAGSVPADPQPASPSDQGDARRMRRNIAVFAVLAVVAVIAAAVAGYAFGSGGFGAKGLSSAELTENELDTVIASWSYRGAAHQVTAREAIESQYGLDSVRDEEAGTYPAPSAESVVAFARNQIMVADAEGRGVSVTDDEVAAYAERNIGTSDFAAIGQQYEMSEDQARSIIRELTVIDALYQEIAGDAGTVPDAPAEPADDAADTPTKEYADYIIELAGDEWDAEAGTWASPDGTVARALENEDFSAEAATYDQAQMAYRAVYAAYSTDANELWSSYANDLFAQAQVTLYGLFA